MDVAILIAHELKIRQRNSDRFCADPKETADINDCRTAGTCPMDMVDLSDLMVVRAIYGCTFENSWCQFRWVQANVIGVVHVVSSVRFVCGERTTNSLVCSWAICDGHYKKILLNQIGSCRNSSSPRCRDAASRKAGMMSRWRAANAFCPVRPDDQLAPKSHMPVWRSTLSFRHRYPLGHR
ncbi:hypothetical protein D3C71_1467230 [compost metagenome]